MDREGLESQEIHIWTWSLDAWNRGLDLGFMLSREESERAQAMRMEHHRRRWIASRTGLRIILAHYLQSQPQQVRFCKTEYGKLILAPPQPTLCFNLSHSDDLAAAAIAADAEIGIDIERERDVPEWNEIAQRFFSDREYEALCRVPEAARRRAFFRCWTRKEAYLKARGVGLSMPLRDFDVTVSGDQPARILSIHGDSGAAEHWHVYDFQPAEHYSGAVVIESALPLKVVKRSLFSGLAESQ